jgi:hypothetical protein
MSRDDWPDIRAHITTELQGEQPGPHLEEELIDIYCQNPAAILNHLPSIAQSKRDGKINSGWAVLRTAAAKAALKPTTPTAVSKEKLIRNVDQWLKNAGLHYPTWGEVEDELFDPSRGRLRSLDTPQLRTKYRDAWEAIRPTGLAVDAAELERADLWRSQQEARASIPKQPTPEDVEEFRQRMAAIQ